MLPLTKPDISFDEVADDIRAILESGRLTRGPYLDRFEESIASYVGTRFAVGTSSATTALHLGLLAAGVGTGDEVLVSDFTFPASGNVIVQLGATPVLVDCLPGRFDLDPADASRKVSERTAAIMPVDPFGQPAEMSEIVALTHRHGIAVVEDAACALGAERSGRRCGAWPLLGCFSFHPRKIVTCGEGGMITTDDAGLAVRLRTLRNHGAVSEGSSVSFETNGYNYRLSEIQAALGLVQLNRIDDIVDGRRTTARCYIEALAGLSEIGVPLSDAQVNCTFQSFVIMLDERIDRDRVVHDLAAQGIESTIGTYALHAQPAFARFGYKPGDLANSWRAYRQSLTLPLVPRMSAEAVAKVVTALKTCLARM